MLKSAKRLRYAAAGLAGLIQMISACGSHAADVANGAAIFKKCISCHKVGPGAKSTVGPHLNDVFGRKLGSLQEFRAYSPNMKKAGAEGQAWSDDLLRRYLENPRAMIQGTRMAFPGIKSEKERDDVIAYLKTHSKTGAAAPAELSPGPAKSTQSPKSLEPATPAQSARLGTTSAAIKKDPNAPRHGRYNLGRPATQEEISAWNIDVRADGQGLPKGKGTVAQGEPIYTARCASCHGDFGEGIGRWPVLAGGKDSLKSDRPEKTIGSYWPYLSTVWDYVHRAMPFGDAQSLTDDEVYSVVAYLMFLNDVVTDKNFELSDKNFSTVKLPNEANFIADDRPQEPIAKASEPCMKNCLPGLPKIIMRARILDVTPATGKKNDRPGHGAIE